MRSLNSTAKIWICTAFLLALITLAWFLRPTELLAKSHPLVLTQIFPESFGDWKVDDSITPLEVTPELKAKLDKTYDQTLSRTYINSQGYRIMLSVAYGGNQSSDSTQVHRPEFCYTAQGFSITRPEDVTLKIAGQPLPVRRMVASLRQRIEPISYWITIGDQATVPGIGRKLLQLQYGLSGRVPDGLLIRISSIDGAIPQAYVQQVEFMGQLRKALATKDSNRVFGI